MRHQTIITRFGRYPHRNAILGPTSSAEELVFLRDPGSAFSVRSTGLGALLTACLTPTTP